MFNLKKKKIRNKILLKAFCFFEKYSWILGVIMLVYGISIYAKNKIAFQLNHSESYGVIYDVSSLRVVRFSKLQFKYKFSYQGKEYFGTSTKTLNSKPRIGRIFKVKFSTQNPNENEIFFEHEYVRKIISVNNEKRDTIYINKN